MQSPDPCSFGFPFNFSILSANLYDPLEGSGDETNPDDACWYQPGQCPGLPRPAATYDQIRALRRIVCIKYSLDHVNLDACPSLPFSHLLITYSI